MKISDQTAIRVTLGLTFAVLATVASLAWSIGALETKVDTMWSAYTGEKTSAAAAITTNHKE